jgi:predicted helicase
MLLNHKKAAEFGQDRFTTELTKITNLQDFVTTACRLTGDKISDDEKNTIKGELFEIFVEYCIRTMGGCGIIPVDREGYEPNNNNDYGVDGIGKYNGHVVTIQCKFKSNRFDTNHGYIGYRDISTFFRQSVTKYHVDPDRFREQAMVFTTGNGYNDNEKEGGDQQPWLVNFNSLDAEIGSNNERFWLDFTNSLRETYEAKVQIKPRKELRPHQVKALNDIIAALGN